MGYIRFCDKCGSKHQVSNNERLEGWCGMKLSIRKVREQPPSSNYRLTTEVEQYELCPKCTAAIQEMLK